MAFYFRPFPLISYDIKKNNKPVFLTNIMTRFKIVEAFQRQEAVYYNYAVKDGERADVIAFKYYGDVTLDWIIYVTNDIIDPEFDWPLSTNDLNKFMVKKYGSITAANEQVHHYEQIINESSVQFDGTVIPARYEEIDLTTYNTLSSSEKRIVTSYEYEVERNDDKRDIKLLSSEFVAQVLAQVNTAFE
jgi:hypothetical protein